MLVLRNNQQCVLSIQPVDAKNQPASVDGVPVWASSDETIATVQADVDGMGATVLAVGPVGTVQISVQADADLGEGVKNLTGTLDVQVTGGEAVALVIGTGTPTDQPVV